MINQAAEVIHYKNGSGVIIDHKPEIKMPHAKTMSDSGMKTSQEPPRKEKQSPSIGRRILPNAPSIFKSNASKPRGSVKKSKSTEELHLYAINQDEKTINETISKYKYNSLPRKKKEGKSKPSITSTFYVDSNNTKQVSSPKIKTSSNSSPKQKRKESIDKNTLKKKESKSNENFSIIDRQTHVALYKFHARHKDEISFAEGDPIQVLKVFDDLWYEGVNLTSGKQGVFPCRYVADILAQDLMLSTGLSDSDYKQYHMSFLGSIEVADYKGDEVLCFAIAKVLNQRSMLTASNPPQCVLQVHSKGIRITNIGSTFGTTGSNNNMKSDGEKKGKKGKNSESTEHENSASHFFSLKNVTFCGNHPKDRRYFGFITKHPDEYRFACHIFMSKYSTDQVAKSIGESFKKFYESYMEYRAPTEDIYIE